MSNPFTEEDVKLIKNTMHNRLLGAYEDANDSMGKYHDIFGTENDPLKNFDALSIVVYNLHSMMIESLTGIKCPLWTD